MWLPQKTVFLYSVSNVTLKNKTNFFLPPELQIYSFPKRLSTLHPQIAIKKSSAFSSVRHRSNSCLPFLQQASSSLFYLFYQHFHESFKQRFILHHFHNSLLIHCFCAKVVNQIGTYKQFNKSQENPGSLNSLRHGFY